MAKANDIDELLSVSSDSDELLELIRADEIKVITDAIEQACTNMHRSWSGSNFGYHANVYYRGLSPKPAGKEFSREWGLMERWPTHSPDPGWEVMDEVFVKDALLSMAGEPDLDGLSKAVSDIRSKFDTLLATTSSILSAALSRDGNDAYLRARLDRAEKLEIPYLETIRQKLLPLQVVSRDSLAMGQGLKLSPHQAAADTALWVNFKSSENRCQGDRNQVNDGAVGSAARRTR